MFQPQNLVLTGEFPDCDVKLCDFGISRYISHGADIREILGTPDYVGELVLLRYVCILYPIFVKITPKRVVCENRENVTKVEGVSR